MSLGLTPSSPWMLKRKGSARYVRNRTRFVTAPPELDVNSSNPILVNAALAAGLYPKILSIDPKNGQMKTIINAQHASFHPSSVNFGKNPMEFGITHLSYFTLMWFSFSTTDHLCFFSDAGHAGIRRNCMPGKLDQLMIYLSCCYVANVISRWVVPLIFFCGNQGIHWHDGHL